MSLENSSEFAYIIGDTINRLVDRGVITTQEASDVKSGNLDEITMRLGHDFDKLGKIEEFTPEQKAKVRTMLGLTVEIGEQEVDEATREKEIDRFVVEMRDYLLELQKDHPCVLGFLLMGSRMNKKKIPKTDSDADIIMILKEGYTTDSSSEQGRTLVSELDGFVRNNLTNSGIEVGTDDFYTADELADAFGKAPDSIPESIRDVVLWSMNTEALHYIGNDLGLEGSKLDEKGIDSFIKDILNSDKGRQIREKMLGDKKQEIVDSN